MDFELQARDGADMQMAKAHGGEVRWLCTVSITRRKVRRPPGSARVLGTMLS